MKKIKSLRIAFFLFLCVMATSHVYSGTMAKYVTSASVEDSARVAGWGVNLSMSGNLYGKHYESYTASSNAGEISISKTNSVDAFVPVGIDEENVKNIVAPGTKNSTGITVRVSGTPEVTTRFKLKLEGEDICLPGKRSEMVSQIYGVMEVAQHVTAQNVTQFFTKNVDNNLIRFQKATTYDSANTYYELLDQLVLEKRSDKKTSYYPIRWTLTLLNYEGGEVKNDSGDIIIKKQRTLDSYHDVMEALKIYLYGYTGCDLYDSGYFDDNGYYYVTFEPNKEIDIAFQISWEWPFLNESNPKICSAADTILGKAAKARMLPDENWYVVTEDSTVPGTYMIAIDENDIQGTESKFYDYNLESELSIEASLVQVD